jgi:hypothetical protein
MVEIFSMLKNPVLTSSALAGLFVAGKHCHLLYALGNGIMLGAFMLERGGAKSESPGRFMIASPVLREPRDCS